jgi:ionotropic glutamate receptor
VFFCNIICQYRRFTPEDGEEAEVDEIQPPRPQRSVCSTSLKKLIGFIDRKEEAINEMIKPKSTDIKRQGSPSSDGHTISSA